MESSADDGGAGGLPSGPVYEVVGLGGGGGAGDGGGPEERVQGSADALLVLFVSLVELLECGWRRG